MSYYDIMFATMIFSAIALLRNMGIRFNLSICNWVWHVFVLMVFVHIDSVVGIVPKIVYLAAVSAALAVYVRHPSEVT